MDEIVVVIKNNDGANINYNGNNIRIAEESIETTRNIVKNKLIEIAIEKQIPIKVKMFDNLETWHLIVFPTGKISLDTIDKKTTIDKKIIVIASVLVVFLAYGVVSVFFNSNSNKSNSSNINVNTQTDFITQTDALLTHTDVFSKSDLLNILTSSDDELNSQKETQTDFNTLFDTPKNTLPDDSANTKKSKKSSKKSKKKVTIKSKAKTYNNYNYKPKVPKKYYIVQ